MSPTPADQALSAAVQAAADRFSARNPRSAALHAEAVNSMPGGNTRTTLHTSPFPVYMRSGRDFRVTSEDGHVYTDFVGEFTAGLYGHSHPVIVEAMRECVATTGLNLGAQTAHEVTYSRALCERFGLERVRFTNSGTEANLHALAAARAFTGKRKVVVFGGGYHGGVLGFVGGKPGRNNVDLADWVVVDGGYNDIDKATEAIRGEGVAAVLVEGVQGSAGAIAGSFEFMRCIQIAAKEAGVLFILDEVMTSRLSPGGIADLYKLEPDLRTMGKWLGGGLASGMLGGRADVMAAFDPRSPGALTHGGTFNNNTLAMYVGHAGLSKIYTPEACVQLNKIGDDFRNRLAGLTKGTKLCFTGVGSLLASHFTDEGLQEIVREVPENAQLKDLFWYEMLEDGFWLVRRGNISLILGTDEGELNRFCESVAAFLERHGDLVKVSPK
ncbi:PLP-dependent transferase [Coniochaeta ligniaria NRRL 30616]|uniref:PLP-dependent transferase n=1 Tax=Coniochaeta ligniaria NRRL 30616 TaxID=1408157 RepID=A0A1J7JEA2_9PEZI|nr:PLP-dependent transferase [Coniochaeta ligniaria NRRL 30616]